MTHRHCSIFMHNDRWTDLIFSLNHGDFYDQCSEKQEEYIIKMPCNHLTIYEQIVSEFYPTKAYLRSLGFVTLLIVFSRQRALVASWFSWLETWELKHFKNDMILSVA